jgi:Fe-S oxidoreductase
MKFKDDLVEIMIAAREEMVGRGTIPPLVRDYLKSIYVNGNPYKKQENERASWTSDTQVEIYKGHEYLFYVGCVGSYDERGQKIARAVGDILNKAGVSFGVLGNEETCDGNEVRVLGEMGLFQYLAEKNIATFQGKGVQKIIALSPHGFNAIKNEYPKYNGRFGVWHYTQILAEMLQQGSLSVRGYKAKATYHDPCYLGRHNHEYKAPRNVLKAIPDLTLLEMEQNRANALCCGGGGGNFFTDILGGGPDSPNRIRVRQAVETGAELLVVACPQCAKMLEDGIKAEEVEDKLEVVDIAELARRALSLDSM